MRRNAAGTGLLLGQRQVVSLAVAVGMIHTGMADLAAAQAGTTDGVRSRCSVPKALGPSGAPATAIGCTGHARVHVWADARG